MPPNPHLRRQFWTGYCHSARLPAIGEIEAAISRHGYIITFNRFSDLALSLIIETTVAELPAMHTELQKIMTMSALEPLDDQAKGECVIFLNVTFTLGTGDMRIEVPRVPG